MYVLGVSLSHDASAVLIEDGEILAAVEEERLNRVKHWNRVPLNAIGFCLDHAKLTLADLDIVVIAGEREHLDERLAARQREFPELAPHASFASYFRSLLGSSFAGEFRGELSFLNHHLCHVFSAYAVSGQRDALLVALDGAGDGASGAVYSASGGSVSALELLDPDNSLGLLYELVTEHLGFRLFDEYKVMGLAPYGDPARFRSVFGDRVRLDAGGQFSIDRPGIAAALRAQLPERSPETEINRDHQDLAAALQECVETIGLHYFRGLQVRTGHRSLCYAGGVAHNCSFNGKLLYAGVFGDMFVSPASDDAGLALGAACIEVMSRGKWNREQRRDHVYLGPEAAPPGELEAIVARWGAAISCERMRDVEAETAALLADGCVIGWVQGRGEFGPRALGNRSILADPRPEQNKQRINSMIKKREAFRPFAPSVLLDKVADYFEVLPGHATFPTMSIALQVRAEQRATLGAVTHVDGSSRVQTVDPRDNPRYARLIREFGDRTGVYVVLNTSFNNHREPIVSSADDAIGCFLTTRLDYLVIDDLLIRKCSTRHDWLADMVFALHPIVALREDEGGQRWAAAQHRSLRSRLLSPEAWALLHGRLPGTSRELAAAANIPLTDTLLDELFELWSERLVQVTPTRPETRLLWPSAFEIQWF